MNKKIVNLHYAISEHLDEIGKMFKVPVKLTLLARHPTLNDGGVLLSNEDDYDLAIAEIQRLRARAAVVEKTC